MTPALRCHLLIGQPASGKTTLAKALAPLLSARGEPPAQVLSTDAIRAEVFWRCGRTGPVGGRPAEAGPQAAPSPSGSVVTRPNVPAMAARSQPSGPASTACDE